jgi:hypothetical protein
LVTAGPLYAALKGNPVGPLHWGPDQEDALQKLKRYLGEAWALALLDITLPFHLYVHEKRGVGLGVLTQPMESSKREEHKQMWQLASHCEVTTYTTTRLQLITLAQGYSTPH